MSPNKLRNSGYCGASVIVFTSN